MMMITIIIMMMMKGPRRGAREHGLLPGWPRGGPPLLISNIINSNGEQMCPLSLSAS